MAVFLFFPRLQKQLTFSGLSSLKCFAQSEQLLRRAQDVSFFNLGPFQTCTFFLKKKKKILSITRLRLTGHRSEDHMNRWDQNVPPCLSLFRLLQIQKKDPTHQVCAAEVTCSNPGSTFKSMHIVKKHEVLAYKTQGSWKLYVSVTHVLVTM